MALYEAVNGYLGESYVRVYVWAASEDEARRLANAAFEAAGMSLTTHIRFLFASKSVSFATTPDDSGWPVPR